MSRVFISYSRKDLEFVERLVSDLKSAGLAVWYDLSGLDGGTQWGTEIQKAIQQSQYFLLVLSPNSLESKWVQREFLYAENINLKVIPLLYLPCELPMWLLDLQLIDLQGKNYESNFDRVLKALGAQTRADRLQALEAVEKKNRLEAQEKNRIALEEKQKQVEDEENKRKQIEQDDRDKARLEKEAHERRKKEEQQRQQDAEAIARLKAEQQQRKTLQKARNIELWNKWKPAVIRVAGLMILLILVVFIGIQLLSGGFGTSPQPTSTLQPSETKTPVPSPTFTLIPSSTPEPSQTPTPVITVESSFITNIKNYISQNPPTFEDDFSTPNPAWGYTTRFQYIPAMVSDGQLNFSERESFPNSGLFNADNFILQYDFLYEGYNSYGVRFRSSSVSGDESPYYEFTISFLNIDLGKAGWVLIYNDSLAGQELIGSGEVGFIKDFHTLKVSVIGDKIVAFRDDRLLLEMDGLKSGGGSENFIYSVDNLLIFDNVKFWNLDGVDITP